MPRKCALVITGALFLARQLHISVSRGGRHQNELVECDKRHTVGYPASIMTEIESKKEQSKEYSGTAISKEAEVN